MNVILSDKVEVKVEDLPTEALYIQHICVSCLRVQRDKPRK